MNTVKITAKQLGVYGIITEKNLIGGAVGYINYSIEDSKSFNYKTSVTGKLEGNNVEKDDVEIVVPLKYLSNFW